MNDAPAISVLMPVYNAGAHLREAVESILGQTLGDYEFLCVDDGSTDDSTAMLGEYARCDSRIRVISKCNGGVTSALNAGLEQARGRFVARMDADDVAEPDRFAAQVGHLETCPRCVAVGCHITKIDGHGACLPTGDLFTTHEEICAALWEGNAGALPHFGAMFRLSALRSIGGYREQFRTAQDLDLFLRLAEVGLLENVPRPLMRYRVHDGAVSVQRAEEQMRNAREILRQAYARRGMKLPRRINRWAHLVVATKRLRWGWKALEENRHAEARGHAWAVIRRKPLRKFAWQLAFHVALGPYRGRLRSMLHAMKKIAGRSLPAVAPDRLGERRG